MAVDPRLLMVDYSQLSNIGQTVGKGIQGYRMQQTQNLAGKALMGDPTAMADLSERNPAMAAQVSQRLAEQQAAQSQAEMAEASERAKQTLDLFQRFGKAETPGEFINSANSAISAGMYPMLSKAIEKGEVIDEEDYIAAKMIASGEYDEEEFERLKQLRSEAKPYVQELTDAKSTLNGLLAITRPGASSTDQVAAIFQFMKALDPNSVVREGEQMMVMRTDGIFGTMGNYLQRLMDGQTLNQGQLDNLANTALKGFEGRAKSLSEQANFITKNVGGKFGLDPSAIVPSDMLDFESTVRSYRDMIDSNNSPISTTEGENKIVFKGHPVAGDVTEADIQATMAEENMTREQVMQMLKSEMQ